MVDYFSPYVLKDLYRAAILTSSCSVPSSAGPYASPFSPDDPRSSTYSRLRSMALPSRSTCSRSPAHVAAYHCALPSYLRGFVVAESTLPKAEVGEEHGAPCT